MNTVTALQSLQATPIEVPIFEGSIAYLHYLLAYSQIAGKFQGSAGSNHETRWNDLIQLAKNTVTKFTSKNDMIELLTRRSKYNDQLEQLIQQVLVASQHSCGNSMCSFQTYKYFYQNLDLYETQQMLLHVKYYVMEYGTESQSQHIRQLMSLVDYLHPVVAFPKLCVPFWAIEKLNRHFLKEIKNLSPQTIRDDDDSLPASEKLCHKSFAITQCGLWDGNFIAMKKISRYSFVKDEYGLRHSLYFYEKHLSWIQETAYLLPLLGIAWEKEYSYLYYIYPLSTLRSLYDVFSNPALSSEKKRSLTSTQKMVILLDVMHGIQLLHDHGIVHGRLKDTNILLYETEDGSIRGKLTDFGWNEYLTTKIRVRCKGLHGMRWLSPDIVHYEEKINQSLLMEEEQQAIPLGNTGYGASQGLGSSGTLEDHLMHLPYPTYSHQDMYAIGMVILVLVTEKMPFFNIPYCEGVKQQLLTGNTPSFPKNYPDTAVMQYLLDIIYPKCIAKPSSITSTLVLLQELITLTQSYYCEQHQVALQQDVTVREEQQGQVQTEIAELEKQIHDHTVLVEKGRELIRKKEAAGKRITDKQMKKELEGDIERARKRLQQFEKELEEFVEDKDGAENDLEHLQDLLAKTKQTMIQDKTSVLKEYQKMPNFHYHPLYQESLIQCYCLDYEANRMKSTLQVATTAFTPKVLYPWSDTLVERSPLHALYTSFQELHPLLAKRIDEERQAQRPFRYQYIVDSLDTIFRIPMNFTQLPRIYPVSYDASTTAAATAGTGANTTAAARTVTYYTQGNTATITTQQPQQPSQQQQQQQQQPYNPHRANSFRDDHIYSVDTVDGGGGGSSAAALQVFHLHQSNVPDSDDEDFEDDTAANTVEADTFARIQKQKELRGKRASMSQQRMSRYSMSMVHPSAMSGHNSGHSGVGVGGGGIVDEHAISSWSIWDIAISGSLLPPDVLETDGFPNNEYDSYHVQYLSAARGDWDESVGYRRLHAGISDTMIEDYLAQDITPVHVAAMMGNLTILMEFVTQGGLDSNVMDSYGNTALHYACKRGHTTIVMYLISDCGLSPIQENEELMTPIHYACAGGFYSIVKFLMENTTFYVKPSFVDSHFQASLLHWACLSSRIPLIEYLIVHHNISVDKVTPSDQSTCLLWACHTSSKEVVQFLIEHTADPHVTNTQGWTCLHMATASGDVDKVNYLLDVVLLKITDRDVNYKTPFDVAVGAAAVLLQDRKAKGFVTGSIADKHRRTSQADS